jgi:hypothetical protein
MTVEQRTAHSRMRLGLDIRDSNVCLSEYELARAVHRTRPHNLLSLAQRLFEGADSGRCAARCRISPDKDQPWANVSRAHRWQMRSFAQSKYRSILAIDANAEHFGQRREGLPRSRSSLSEVAIVIRNSCPPLELTNIKGVLSYTLDRPT